MVIWVSVKTTIDIPDPLFRTAKARAAERGQSLKEFVAEALHARLSADTDGGRVSAPKWMDGFGKLRRLRNETARIQKIVDEEFDVVEAEDHL